MTPLSRPLLCTPCCSVPLPEAPAFPLPWSPTSDLDIALRPLLSTLGTQFCCSSPTSPSALVPSVLLWAWLTWARLGDQLLPASCLRTTPSLLLGHTFAREQAHWKRPRGQPFHGGDPREYLTPSDSKGGHTLSLDIPWPTQGPGAEDVSGPEMLPFSVAPDTAAHGGLRLNDRGQLLLTQPAEDRKLSGWEGEWVSTPDPLPFPSRTLRSGPCQPRGFLQLALDGCQHHSGLSTRQQRTNTNILKYIPILNNDFILI